MVRAAAKNHANVAIVTSPAPLRGGPRGARLDPGGHRRRRCGARSPSRRSPTPPPTTPGSPRSCPAGWPRPASTCPTSRAARRRRPVSAALTIGAREGRDAALRREPAPAGGPLPAPGERRGDGLFATATPAAPGQGAVATTTSSTPRRRRRSGGPCAGRRCVIVKHTNPCGAAERDDARRCLGRGARGRPGQRVRRGRGADAARWTRPLAERLVSIFLEIVVAPGVRRRTRSRSSPTKPNLRVLLDRPALADDARARPRRPIRPARSGPPAARSSSARPTSPPTTRRRGRAPPAARRRTRNGCDLDLAWRLVRGVTSNAIVLVRDGRLVGMGSGQTSRVDAARQAVAKAQPMLGPGRDDGRRLRVGRVLPVPGRGRGVPRRRA